jgi:hypothetical protein
LTNKLAQTDLGRTLGSLRWRPEVGWEVPVHETFRGLGRAQHVCRRSLCSPRNVACPSTEGAVGDIGLPEDSYRPEPDLGYAGSQSNVLKISGQSRLQDYPGPVRGAGRRHAENKPGRLQPTSSASESKITIYRLAQTAPDGVHETMPRSIPR